jgi:hypothetical protein
LIQNVLPKYKLKKRPAPKWVLRFINERFHIEVQTILQRMKIAVPILLRYFLLNERQIYLLWKVKRQYSHKVSNW